MKLIYGIAVAATAMTMMTTASALAQSGGGTTRPSIDMPNRYDNDDYPRGTYFGPNYQRPVHHHHYKKHAKKKVHHDYD